MQMSVRAHRIVSGFTLAAALLSAPFALAGGLFGDNSKEILPPAEAFQPTAHWDAEGTLRVQFDIRPGHYLYRERIHLAASEPWPELDAAGWPQGEMIEDDFFGASEIYREPVHLYWRPSTVPTANLPPLEVQYQGCADIGICYPPETTVLAPQGTPPTVLAASDFTPLESAADPPAAIGLNPLQDLLGGGSADAPGDDSLLPPEDAFILDVGLSADGAALEAMWQIAPEHYLYRDKLAYRLRSDSGERFDLAQQRRVDQRGIEEHDEFFGDTVIYRDVALETLGLAGVPGGDMVLEVDLQGCADVGVCYPPMQREIPLPLPRLADFSTARTDTAVAALTEQDRLSQSLGTRALWLNLLSFFGLGLLLAFTPCVLPMVPILSSIVIGRSQDGEARPTRQAFMLSLVFVLGMALTYTTVGVLVGLSGMNIQAWFQTPWLLSLFAALFVLLALAMFGVFKLQMPQAIQNRLNTATSGLPAGRYGSVAIMGVLSALIVGPCVTAPLVGALIYIANTGDAWVGGTALFALSLGMGTPLLLVAASAGRWLPKSGRWMERVTQFFGFLLLAMAIWMLSRFLDARVTVMLSTVLALSAGLFLGALDRHDKDSHPAERLSSVLGLICLLYGIALGIGLLSGRTSLRAPLQGVVSGSTSLQDTTLNAAFTPIKGLDGFNAALAEARAAGQPLLLDFYADWCVSCKEMEHLTFADPKVQQRMVQFARVQADVTRNDEADQALMKHFGLFGPPALLIFGPDGREYSDARVVGYMPADRFAAHLDARLVSNL